MGMNAFVKRVYNPNGNGQVVSVVDEPPVDAPAGSDPTKTTKSEENGGVVDVNGQPYSGVQKGAYVSQMQARGGAPITVAGVNGVSAVDARAGQTTVPGAVAQNPVQNGAVVTRPSFGGEPAVVGSTEAGGGYQKGNDYASGNVAPNVWGQPNDMAKRVAAPVVQPVSVQNGDMLNGQIRLGKSVVGTNPNDTRSEYQKFRDSMYDEEKLRKESDRRAKVLAIGDALRNIGNLYYTTKGATPQDFGNVNLADSERQEYEAGRQRRDAIAYQRYNAQLQNDIARAKAAEDARNNESKRALQGAQAAKTLQDMQIQAEEYPYKIQGMIADAALKAQNASKAEYDAAHKKLEYEIYAQYGEKEAQRKLANIDSQIAAHRASAAASYASAENSRASAAKTRDEMVNGKKTEVTTIQGARGMMSRKGKTDLDQAQISSIYNHAKSKGWLKSQANMTTLDDEETKKAKMIDAIVANAASSTELTDYLVDNYGYTINGGSGERWNAKPRGGGGGKGSSGGNVKTSEPK